MNDFFYRIKYELFMIGLVQYTINYCSSSFLFFIFMNNFFFNINVNININRKTKTT